MNEPAMSIRAATAKVSSTIRRSLQAAVSWRDQDDNPYAPAFWIALLLIVGLAVKHVR